MLMWRWLCLLPRIARLGNQVPMNGIEAIIDTLEEGNQGKYAEIPDIWRFMSWKTHWNHLRQHAELLAEQDNTEPHAKHLVCRAAMLAELALKEQAVQMPQYPE